MSRLLLSIVIASHNRRAVLLRTLKRLTDDSSSLRAAEIIVVDNASTDGTRAALSERDHLPPAVADALRVIPLRENLGSCAKAIGCQHARGTYVLFLDDDAYPRPGCLRRMLERFAADHRLAAAGFLVHLPDGRQECSALPGVFVGCGVGLRRSALQAVGGLDASFFMQAEEYDLAFRLAQGGHRVRVFGDLHVEHVKSPTARRSERTTYYDIRNNLRVIARYLPAAAARVYQDDWVQRYRWLAEAAGHVDAFESGLRAGLRLAADERPRYAAWRLGGAAFEQFFTWRRIARGLLRIRAAGQRRVVLIDLSKNIFAFVRAARTAGLEIAAIGDDAFAQPGRAYRGVPVIPVDEALDFAGDAALVISNTSYAHARARHAALAAVTDRPIHRLIRAPDEPAAQPASSRTFA